MLFQKKKSKKEVREPIYVKETNTVYMTKAHMADASLRRRYSRYDIKHVRSLPRKYR